MVRSQSNFGLWLGQGCLTFNNISAISRRSVLLVEETGVPGENLRPAVKRVWRYNYNPHIEQEQTTQWLKEKVQDKQRSTKHTYKTKDGSSNTNPSKNRGEFRCSGRVSSSCSTSGTRRVNLVTNPMIRHEWGKDRKVFTTSRTYPRSFATHVFHWQTLSHNVFEYTSPENCRSDYLCFASRLRYIFNKTWWQNFFVSSFLASVKCVIKYYLQTQQSPLLIFHSRRCL
jgi:hypothetical protein